MLKPLKSKKKIETIFEKGFVIKEGGLMLKAYDFKDSESYFGVSVPKKIFASAVNRNRIKRLLKEGVRAASRSVSLSPGLSFFLIYTDSKILPSEKIFSKINRLLNKLYV
jgi:ribonuclease P protein component